MHKKFLLESKWSVLHAATTGAILFLLNIVLARGLGKEGYGQWMFFFSIFTVFSTLSGLWLDRAAQTYVAYHRDDLLLSDIVADSAIFRASISAAAAVVMWLSSDYIAVLAERPELSVVLRAAAPLLFLKGLCDYVKYVFLGMHRLKFLFLVGFVDNALKLAGVLIALYFTLTHLKIITSFTVAAAIGAAVGFIILIARIPKNTGAKQNFLPTLLKAGSAFLFINLGSIMLLELNTFVLGLYAPNSEVARFTSAKALAQSLPGFLTALFMAAGPLFSDVRGSRNLEAKSLLKKLVLLSGIFILPLFLVMQIGAGFILGILYGPDFRNAAPLLRILSFYMVFLTFSMLMVQVLDYQRMGKLRARNLIPTLIINLILVFWLIPKYGAWGAAIAQTVAFAPYVLLNIYEVRKALAIGASAAAEESSTT